MSLIYNGTSKAFYKLQQLYSSFSPTCFDGKTKEAIIKIDGYWVTLFYWPKLWPWEKRRRGAR